MKESSKGIFLGVNNGDKLIINHFSSNTRPSSFTLGKLGKGRAFRVGELTEEQKAEIKTIIYDPKSDYEELIRKD